MTSQRNTASTYIFLPNNTTIDGEESRKESSLTNYQNNLNNSHIQNIPYLTSIVSSSGSPEFLTIPETQQPYTPEYKKIIDELEKRAQEEHFEPESTSNAYKKILQTLRASQRNIYISLLEDSHYSTLITKKAILRYLASLEYEDIIQEEQDYIIKQLQSNDATVKRYAINALLCWGSFSDITRIKMLNLNNPYLQGILDEFIASQK